MNTCTPAISVRNVSKMYKLYSNKSDRVKEAFSSNQLHVPYYALEGISFDVYKGETVGIIGKNGSGKSTLLKIITDVLHPTSGEVAVNGKISALLELGAGFNPEYTGIQNVFFNGMIMGFSQKEMDQKLDSILQFADIGEYIYQPVKTYSSGMFVRLAFAVAVSVEPDILIVDEALAVGDIAFQAKCMAKMDQIIKNGATILFVTHDTGTIKKMCKRCVYLEKGNIKKIGPAADIADMYLRDIRDDMQREHLKISLNAGEGSGETKWLDPKKSDGVTFLVQDDFEERVKLFREGTGDVRVRAFEMLNDEGESVVTANFNETVRLCIYVEAYKDAQVGAGYHIRDSKNIELLGCGTITANSSMLDAKAGERYMFEFITKLPLVEGPYNITLVISTPVVDNRSALFHDYIENAYVFSVMERQEGKIWNKVYIDNQIYVHCITE